MEAKVHHLHLVVFFEFDHPDSLGLSDGAGGDAFPRGLERLSDLRIEFHSKCDADQRHCNSSCSLVAWSLGGGDQGVEVLRPLPANQEHHLLQPWILMELDM